MQYKSDFLSCIIFSLKLSILSIFLPISSVARDYGWVVFLFSMISVFIVSFVIFYKHTFVYLDGNYLIVKVLKYEFSLNLKEYTCRRYTFSRRPFFHKVIRIYTFLIFVRPLWFKRNDSYTTKKHFIFDFLSREDYFDLFCRIRSCQKLNWTLDYQVIGKFNIENYAYHIDREAIIKVIKKMNRSNMLYVILSLISFLLFILLFTFLHNITFSVFYDICFLAMIGLICFSVFNYSKIHVFFDLIRITSKVANNIYINDKLVIDEYSFNLSDIENIYVNSYFDRIGNEIKSLSVYANGNNYLFYLDYVVGDNINFFYFDNLCKHLKTIFGNTFSRNDL